ncbi:MAG: hypothetical protein J0I10_20100 [Verrucomicrobia bacterium]|nr:hypothetical protein [Verrucomicrobiota bacterium]
MNTENRQRLVGRIERCMDSVCDTFSKSDILSYCRHDVETARECLQQWASEGKLEILKPLDEAQDDEPVVRMKAYIEGQSPWPNWPPKAKTRSANQCLHFIGVRKEVWKILI